MKKNDNPKGQTFTPDLFNTIFDGHHVGFELINGDVMVNATEMARVFGKEVKNFTRLDGTQNYILGAIKSSHPSFLSIEKEEHLIVSKQKTGTWMHRLLALKLAAWLDVDFELWVFATIDEILFGHFRRIEESLKDSARRQTRLEELMAELGHNDKFLEYLQIQSEERRAANARSKFANQQRDVYKDNFAEN